MQALASVNSICMERKRDVRCRVSAEAGWSKAKLYSLLVTWEKRTTFSEIAC
jgi:hypothetical protein